MAGFPSQSSKLGTVLVVGVIVFASLFSDLAASEKLPETAELVIVVALPTLMGLIATCLLARSQGLRAFWRALLISLLVAVAYGFEGNGPEYALPGNSRVAWPGV